MLKKICISGYYGFDNFGDETILQILTENLKRNPDIEEITVFSSNPAKTSDLYKVNAVQSFDLLKVLMTLFKCDCLISGGGSLLQDVTSKKSLIYYLLLLYIAFFLHKKIIIFAQGIGPVNNKILANAVRFILKKANFITVRDNNSYELLSKWGIKSQKCNDPVWNLNIPVSKDKTNTLGIQLRSFPLLNNSFLYVLACYISKYYSDKNIKIFSLQNKLDLSICNDFRDKLLQINRNLKIEVIENTANEKIIKDIASVDELIAMRYHACLIAVKSGIKLVGINYDIKVEELSKDFNFITLNLDDTEDVIIKKLEEFRTLSDFEYKTDDLMFDFEKMSKIILENKNNF